MISFELILLLFIFFLNISILSEFDADLAGGFKILLFCVFMGYLGYYFYKLPQKNQFTIHIDNRCEDCKKKYIRDKEI